MLTHPDIVTDCDSLFPEIVLPPGSSAVCEADVFGSTSRVVEDASTSLLLDPVSFYFQLSDNYAYQVLVLLILFLAGWLAYYYRDSAVTLFRVITARLSPQKAFDEQTLFFKRFMRLTSVLGGALVVGVLIKVGEYAGVFTNRGVELSPLVMNLLVPLCAVLVALTYFYRKVIVLLIGTVIQNQVFFQGHTFVTQIYSHTAYLVLTPLFLIVALSPPDQMYFLFWGIGLLLIAFYIGYLVQSCRYFVGKNVSILQWFLYLCAVDFFPISFYLFLALRNMS